MDRDLLSGLPPEAAPTLPDPEGPLPDILAPGLDCLFVGFNPGLRSGGLGHHYAGRGNQFWRLLAASGLTPRLMRAEEDASLPAVGLGSTNLVTRATASAAELSRAELRGGVPRLARIVAAVRPAVLAYTGKGVYLAASGRPDAPWGVQDSALFVGVADVVVPSPSGLARLPFEEKLRWYKAVKNMIDRRRS
ncbi:TDG/mug DNA glycosylase family protein [Azospirillum agricola]|uniref:mismatch-specific DNA-glycosylase n=1 Tax=Azospirillum agricola TaxID=1720247 RepID=UPI001AE2B70F|nr:mismatch-specific DNA-glycosylase [Azospirillum agricola]MBP2231597.1 TDG/mug DNA glycosylase family protein [Azospirillum agricola]